MVPGLLTSVDAVPERQARARPHLHLEALRDGDARPDGDQRPLAGRERQAGGPPLRREVGAEVHAGRAVGGVAGSGSAGSRPGRRRDRDGDGHASASAMRSASRSAVAAFDIRGQGSAPSAVISVTALSGPPMMPVAGRTSLATIQSAPLRSRLATAFSTTSSVSAAKPTTSRGRPSPRPATVRRMSGFSASASVGGGAPAAFLTLLPLRVGDVPVGDGGGEDRGVGRQRRLDGGEHLARGLDLDDRGAEPAAAPRPAR